MTDEWATFGADLHLDLTGSGVRATLERALRDAVRTGRLTPGTRLPSSRSLARDLAIARNTVADAYGSLVAEGWLTAQQGSGTRVADRALPVPDSAPPPEPAPAAMAHDLRSGTPDLGSFPRAAWLTATKRALTVAPNEAFGYGDPRGRIELRAALAEYLARARGVRASPERIVICTGYIQVLALLPRRCAARASRRSGSSRSGLNCTGECSRPGACAPWPSRSTTAAPAPTSWPAYPSARSC